MMGLKSNFGVFFKDIDRENGDSSGDVCVSRDVCVI